MHVEGSQLNVIASLLDFFKIFSEVLIASECSPLARLCQAVIKTGPTEMFLENKRNTRISGPQLKIINQIMTYRWSFGKDPLKQDKILRSTPN